MSNSREQSLDEDAVFLPVNESSPEFLHCERERQAVETLLNAGPEAFYSFIGAERSGCFLSSQEVSQITSWAQDYRFNPLQVQGEEEGAEDSAGIEDFCSTYFPSYSDTPAPNLELGWPEKSPWVPTESITVHTSPPAEGEPPVREVIRRHLQKACQVIAIVTDRLTDGAIIDDLHNAASRGVPVYIILNQRPIQENFTLNRFRHPNMQVRVLGGKTFCSRTGRMVVGEMKNKFILVDLETVIHGSYSLTWTDAHLHRQLITVLRGPVVDSFDREFRILFASSLPVSGMRRVAGTHVDVTHQLRDFSHLGFQKHFALEPEITNPPSPSGNYFLDWEAMGVVQRDGCLPDSHPDQHEMPLQNNRLSDKKTPVMDGFTTNGNQFVHKKRVSENPSAMTNNEPDKSTTFKNAQPTPTDLPSTSPERIKRVEHILEKALSRKLSTEKSNNLDYQTTTRLNDKAMEPTHNMVILSSTTRRHPSKKEPILEEKSSMNESRSKVESTPSSRRPIILSVPQSESFSPLNDFMKRLLPQQSASGPLRRESKAAVSELSQSMMNLSVHSPDTKPDERGAPVPEFKASRFDLDHMTPAIALMKKRNDELKPLLYSTSKTFLPRERPRSSTYTSGVSWRRSLAEMERDQECEGKK
ncbi:uncharacterized protein fam83e [Pempheris klunzingeri]|uniref:uncharacterized protein fam83e n=1 Tax=Pempheris klunzingeri TaxID=3127111 RepID=UPI0039800249